MMIKCSKCGYENQMGSIFCRGCGEKINMDDLDPAALKNEAEKSKKKGSVMKSLRGAISFVIFLAVVALLAGLFLPFGHGSYVSQPEDVLKSAADKIESYETLLNMPRRKTPVVLEFSQDEINALFEKRFFGRPSKSSGSDGEADVKKEKASSGAYSIEDISFTVSGDMMTITLYTRLAKQIPTVFTITGTPGREDDGKITFTTQSAKMGFVPMPSFAKKFIVEKFAPLENPPELQTLFKNSSSVETVDGKVIFKFNKTPASKGK